MKVVLKFVAIVASLLACAFDAHAQPRTLTAAESCYAMGTLRQFRDNEFSHYSAPSAIAGSAGLGCDLLEVRGLPLGMSVMFGAFAEVQETAAFDRQSGMSGDMLTKKMPAMAFAGGTAELKLPTMARLTPSILLRYGLEVGSLVLPRGSYTDASGWEHSFAMRYTNELGVGGCLDYNKAVKLCAEYARLTYDTYPHIWIDPNGRQQGRPEPITVANEVVGRLIVPFSSLRM